MKEQPASIEHEILKQLKRAGIEIASTGSEAEDYTPIDKFLLPTASLHYGTLVYLLNTPERDIQPSEGPIYWNKIKKKKREVTITVFSWNAVADALLTLAFNGDIKDNSNESLNIEERVISLTAQGLVTCNKKTYLTNAINENLAFQISHSTLNTNWWIKRIGILTVLFTGIIAGTSVMQCNKDSHLQKHTKHATAVTSDTSKNLN